jgi:predicted  nucleic acid-binding Zn-ribbon protein
MTVPLTTGLMILMSKQTFSEDSLQTLHNLVDSLRRERDQLSVKANLGKMELRDEWQEVEVKWRAFERTLEEANDDAKQSLHEVGQEIAEAYNRLKSKLG